MEGYIFLQRKIFEWEWWSDINTFRLWTVILLLANYTDKQWHGIDVKRGQLVTSLESLSKKSGLSVRSVRTSLNHLISTGEITSKSTNKYRIITVEKYDEYQDWRKLNDKQSNNQDNKQATSKRQASDKQATTTNTLNTLNTKNIINKKHPTEETGGPSIKEAKVNMLPGWTLEEKLAAWRGEE